MHRATVSEILDLPVKCNKPKFFGGLVTFSVLTHFLQVLRCLQIPKGAQGSGQGAQHMAGVTQCVHIASQSNTIAQLTTTGQNTAGRRLSTQNSGITPQGIQTLELEDPSLKPRADLVALDPGEVSNHQCMGMTSP